MLHNFYLIASVACILLCACKSDRDGAGEEASGTSESASGIDQSALNAEPADVSSIDAIVKALSASISFREGTEPNLERLRSLCHPNALFISVAQEGVETMNVESFVSFFKELVKTGTLKSLYEKEIVRKTEEFGQIAQVFSTYSKRVNPEDLEPTVQGINSIQLYNDGKRWWVSSVMWEEERSDNLIPPKYLRNE